MVFFLSYCSADERKMKSLKKALEKAFPTSRVIVVAEEKDPGKPLAEKVTEGVLSCTHFVPIVTRRSITNQWVNQEIGFAHAGKKKVDTIPIVERQIIKKLKGLINSQTDLPFSFSASPRDSRREARAFRASYLALIDYLTTTKTTVFNSKVEPSTVRKGESYSTTVEFRGTIVNGFFDNRVVHLESDFKTWNWDPQSLPPRPQKTTPGLLNGSENVVRTYEASTATWPSGRYKIYVRLYSHLKAGEIGRQVVQQNEHDLTVI